MPRIRPPAEGELFLVQTLSARWHIVRGKRLTDASLVRKDAEELMRSGSLHAEPPPDTDDADVLLERLVAALTPLHSAGTAGQKLAIAGILAAKLERFFIGSGPLKTMPNRKSKFSDLVVKRVA